MLAEAKPRLTLLIQDLKWFVHTRKASWNNITIRVLKMNKNDQNYIKFVYFYIAYILRNKPLYSKEYNGHCRSTMVSNNFQKFSKIKTCEIERGYKPDLQCLKSN